MRASGPVIDAWMQHPGPRWIDDEMFASLRRWKPGPFSETAPPPATTVEAMDKARVSRGLLCARSWGSARCGCFRGCGDCGSNHPFWLATDWLAGFDDLDLDEKTERAFLHENATAAFRLD